MEFLESFDIMNDGRGPGLDAAMLAVERRILSDLRVREAVGLLLRGKEFDVLAERSLVAFQREKIIGFFVVDGSRDLALAPPSGHSTRLHLMEPFASLAYGVDGHDSPLDGQHFQ